MKPWRAIIIGAVIVVLVGCAQHTSSAALAARILGAFHAPYRSFVGCAQHTSSAALAARILGAFHAPYQLAQAEAAPANVPADEATPAAAPAEETAPAAESETAAPAAESETAAPVDTTKAITAGREALNPGWRGYPWYDSGTDDLRRIRVPRTRNWSSPNWNPSFHVDWVTWVIWGFVALAFALLAYLLYQVYRGRWIDLPGSARAVTAQPVANDASRVEALPFQIDPLTGSLLDAARRAYAGGDFARAIIYLFSHQLVELDRRHLIRLTRGKTNRQYVRELRGKGALPGLLSQTMVVFEDVYFGDRALSRERFEICWNRLNEFDALVGPRR
jgi:hypothetical protein